MLAKEFISKIRPILANKYKLVKKADDWKTIIPDLDKQNLILKELMENLWFQLSNKDKMFYSPRWKSAKIW